MLDLMHSCYWLDMLHISVLTQVSTENGQNQVPSGLIFPAEDISFYGSVSNHLRYKEHPKMYDASIQSMQ